MSSVHVAKVTVPYFAAGSGTVGETESPVNAINLPVHKGVSIKAASDNSGTIAVGTPGNSINGWVLAAGEEIGPIPVEQLSMLAIVGSAASQAYYWWLC